MVRLLCGIEDTCVFMYIICMYMSVHGIYVHLYMSIHICMCVYYNVCVYIYIMFVYIYTNIDHIHTHIYIPPSVLMDPFKTYLYEQRLYSVHNCPGVQIKLPVST